MPAQPDSLPRTRPAGSRWSDLRTRVASAAVLAPVALGCLWWGGLAWVVLLALTAVGLAAEWVVLCGGRRRVRTAVLLTAVLVAAGVLMALDRVSWAMAALVIGAGILWAFTRDWRVGAGVPYLGLGCLGLIWLRVGVPGLGNVLYVVLIVWASDIGAYAAGRALGGPRLAPAISPGKTWSGAWGGLVSAILVGFGVAAGVAGVGLGRATLIAGVLGVVSQAGDLFESWLKRGFGVKDSGRLIPGHGGLLDRLDGLLAAATVAAGFSLIVGHGAYLWQ